MAGSMQFPCVVWRIRLRWDGARWKVERRTRIEAMTLPRSLDAPTAEAAAPGAGSSYELRDAEGELVYRQHLAAAPEAFLANGTMRRDPLPAEPTVDVLVPDTGVEGVLRLVSSELPGPEEALGGAGPVVAELPLGELTRIEEQGG